MPEASLPHDHRFYPAMATVLAVLVLAGFTPSFYARGWSADLAPLPLAVVLHGVAGTLFVLTFAAQSWLIAAGRASWHRQLGVAGALLALGLAVSGIVVTVNFEQSHSPEPLRVLAAHFSSNAVPIAVFGLLVAAGVWQRGVPARHKRLMLLAAVVVLPPGTGRLFAVLELPWLIMPVFVCAAFANAAYDLVTRGRPHALSLWLAVALVTMDLAIRRWLVAVGS